MKSIRIRKVRQPPKKEVIKKVNKDSTKKSTKEVIKKVAKKVAKAVEVTKAVELKAVEAVEKEKSPPQQQKRQQKGRQGLLLENKRMRKHDNLRLFFNVAILIILIILVSSCETIAGSVCYPDPSFAQNASYVIKNVEVTVVPGQVLDTGIYIDPYVAPSSTSTTPCNTTTNPGCITVGQARLTVTGQVSMIQTGLSPQMPEYVRQCISTPGVTSTGEATNTLGYVLCTGTSSEADDYATICNAPITLTETSPCYIANSICDNQILKIQNANGQWVNSGTCGSDPTLVCHTFANGNQQMAQINMTPSSTTPSSTTPSSTTPPSTTPSALTDDNFISLNIPCKTQTYGQSIDVWANSSTWTQLIGGTNQIYKGDNVTLIINAPSNPNGVVMQSTLSNMGVGSPSDNVFIYNYNRYHRWLRYSYIIPNLVTGYTIPAGCPQSVNYFSDLKSCSILQCASSVIWILDTSTDTTSCYAECMKDSCAEVTLFYPNWPCPNPTQDSNCSYLCNPSNINSSSCAWNHGIEIDLYGCTCQGGQLGTMTPVCTSMQDSINCLWNVLGNGLWLNTTSCTQTTTSSSGKSTTTSTTITSSSSNIGFTDTSNPYQYGIAKTTTNGDSTPINVIKSFIARGGTTQFCAGMIGDYTKLNGGYQVQLQIQSGVAVNGHPSPAFDNGSAPAQTLGALLYSFAPTQPTDQNGAVLFSDALFSDGTESSTTSTTTPTNAANITNSSQTGGNLLLQIDSRYVDGTTPGGIVGGTATGIYTVNIQYAEQHVPVIFSGIIEWVKDSIVQIIFGTDANPGPIVAYFNSLSQNASMGPQFINLIQILLTLYIILYGLAVLTGHMQVSPLDLLIRTVKIGVVLTLISNNSWKFFNTYFFQLFLGGTDSLIAMTGIGSCNGCNTFSFVDSSMEVLFAPTTWLKILALFVFFPLGLIVAPLLLVAIILFLFGVFNVVIAYLLCVFAISVLIALAPIFIPFCLFEFTKDMFTKWWKLLARYALEPVLLIIGLQILVQIFYTALIQIMNFTVCWKCTWPISLNFSPFQGILDALNIVKFLCVPFFGPHGQFQGGGGAPFTFITPIIASGIMAIIIAAAMKKYDLLVHGMMDQLLGERPGTGPTSNPAEAAMTRQFVYPHAGLELAQHGASSFMSGKVRDGIKRMTGIEIKTKETMEREKAEESKTIKHKGLSMLSPLLDQDSRNIDKGLDGVAKDLKKAREKNNTADIDKAKKAVGEQFLGRDPVTRKTFISKLSKFANSPNPATLPVAPSVHKFAVDKFRKLLDIPKPPTELSEAAMTLHRFLQDKSIKDRLPDLLSQDNAKKHRAQGFIANAISKDKKLSEMLLNRETRRELLDTIFRIKS